MEERGRDEVRRGECSMSIYSVLAKVERVPSGPSYSRSRDQFLRTSGVDKPFGFDSCRKRKLHPPNSSFMLVASGTMI